MDTIFTYPLCLTVLFLGTVVLSEDRQGSGPSAETLRRYLYEHRLQLDRLKPGLFGSPDQDADSPADEEPPGNPYDRPRSLDGRLLGLGGAAAYRQATPTWNRGQPEFADVNAKGYPEPDDDLTYVEAQGYTPQKATGDWRVQDRQLDSEDNGQPQTQSKKSDQQKSQSEALPFSQGQADTATEARGKNPLSDVYFVVIVAGCSAAAIFGVIAAGYCFYRFQKNSKAAAEVDYPAYGVTGPNKDQTSPNGDRRLAQSAQMYHYQHQKQQMIAVEKATTARNTSASDIDSEEENEEGDYTVYECPGLAPTGEMEVKNPLFHDDSTPMSPPVVTAKENKKP